MTVAITGLSVFHALGGDDQASWTADAWGYCAVLDDASDAALDAALDDWSVRIPPEADFDIDWLEGALRFRGSAEEPEFAPQIVLSDSLWPSLEQVFEVVAAVDIEELGGVLALDVDDEEGRYNWSLDVSATLVSFGFADRTCACGSGWIRVSQLDESQWGPDQAEGGHILRIIFERRTVKAYVDEMRIATFGLPDDVAQGVIRLSVGSAHLPDESGDAIEYTNVRVVQLCFAEGS